jgi:L-malate glycosyltransferase
MKKHTLLYLIDDLGIGGAESLLLGIMRAMSQRYSIVLVTLNNKCEYNDSLIFCDYRYSLGITTNKLTFVRAVFRLRKLIQKHSPVLAHSHLFYSSLLCRLACSRKIPLIFSVHSQLSQYVFDKSKLLAIVEKLTVNKSQTIIAVSNTVLQDYERSIDFKGDKFVLENYIDDAFQSNLKTPGKQNITRSLRIIAVGNLKKVKNYEYLIKSFTYLKGLPVSLDIYGKIDTPLFYTLQSQIEENNLPVIFKGVTDQVHELFSSYDLFVMSSFHEGFGIAAVEAMASGLPVLLSDLPVLREVSCNNAIFFNINDPESFTNEVKKILKGEHDLDYLSKQGKVIAKKYSKKNYLQKLNAIYDEILIPACVV